jgi:hypothetical protein
MSRCLRTKTLLLIRDEEGNSRQRTHLQECESCAKRYKALGRDLQAITDVLRQPPPPMSHRFHPLAARRVRAAAALALALVVISVGVRLWTPAAWLSFTRTGNGENWSMIDDLPTNFFLLNEALAVELATEGSGSYELAATVLEAERFCEWYDLPLPGRTESAIEELESVDMRHPFTCIETNQDDDNAIRSKDSRKKIS